MKKSSLYCIFIIILVTAFCVACYDQMQKFNTKLNGLLEECSKEYADFITYESVDVNKYLLKATFKNVRAKVTGLEIIMWDEIQVTHLPFFNFSQVIFKEKSHIYNPLTAEEIVYSEGDVKCNFKRPIFQEGYKNWTMDCGSDRIAYFNSKNKKKVYESNNSKNQLSHKMVGNKVLFDGGFSRSQDLLAYEFYTIIENIFADTNLAPKVSAKSLASYEKIYKHFYPANYSSKLQLEYDSEIYNIYTNKLDQLQFNAELLKYWKKNLIVKFDFHGVDPIYVSSASLDLSKDNLLKVKLGMNFKVNPSSQLISLATEDYYTIFSEILSVTPEVISQNEFGELLAPLKDINEVYANFEYNKESEKTLGNVVYTFGINDFKLNIVTDLNTISDDHINGIVEISEPKRYVESLIEFLDAKALPLISKKSKKQYKTPTKLPELKKAIFEAIGALNKDGMVDTKFIMEMEYSDHIRKLNGKNANGVLKSHIKKISSLGQEIINDLS